jgi:tripartite ATP-independent transporter DctM subunit
MDPISLATIGVAIMLALIALHVPIGIAMAAVGFGGVWLLLGFDPAVKMFATAPTQVTTQELGAIPLFLLMGAFAGAAGLSGDLYRLFHAFVGHRRGGLAMATIGGCGGFGAVCGSSVATAATFLHVALPEMLDRRYQPALATGSIAAGGTLGILIPPSNMMLLYAVLTEQFVVALFIAGIIPGIVTILIYWSAIAIYTRFRPDAGPRGPRIPWGDRGRVVLSCWGVIVLAAVVSAGIYGGVFTVLEGAGVGAIFATLFTWYRGRLNREVFWKVLSQAAATTGFIYIIVIGANILGFFITLTQMPDLLVRDVQALGLPGWLIVTLLLAIYILLGAIFDEVATMIITLPVVFPLIVGLGYDPIWWGIINVVVIMIGQIAPPIGIICFVLHGMVPNIPLRTIYLGIAPFFAGDIVRLTLLVIFPVIALWLPQQLGMLGPGP